jgi:hypothetical protein
VARAREADLIFGMAVSRSTFGGLIAYVYYRLTLTFIFRKAGLKAWPAWVPIFNMWRLLQLGGQRGWWILIASGAGIVMAGVAPGRRRIRGTA